MNSSVERVLFWFAVLVAGNSVTADNMVFIQDSVTGFRLRAGIGQRFLAIVPGRAPRVKGATGGQLLDIGYFLG